MRISLTRLFAASAALALTAGSAHAELIYAEDFAGDGLSGLNGTTPDVSTTGEDWIAGSPFNNGGGISGEDGSATLAFTPVDGKVYTLDVSFTGVSGDTNWIAAGYASGQSTNVDGNGRFVGGATSAIVRGRAWAMIRGDSSANESRSFNGDMAQNPLDWGTTAQGGVVDFRFILDTTAGAGSWTIEMLADLDGGQDSYSVIRATEAVVNESINSVGIAASSSTVSGTVTNFTLDVVPEPSSLALLGLGGLCVLRRRRSA